MPVSVTRSYQEILSAPVEGVVVYPPRRRLSPLKMQYILFKMVAYLLAMGCVMAFLLLMSAIVFAAIDIDVFGRLMAPVDAN